MADFPYRRDVDAAAEEAHRAARRQPADRERMPLERARKVADAIVEVLRPACERIEIVGSVRRRVAHVKDVEILCVPHLALNLFGEPEPNVPTHLELLVDELVAVGRLEPRETVEGIKRRGRRYQALRATKSGLALDLFSVLPPASWGAQMAIRTGPAEYSKHLVTVCQRRGLRCEDGRLVDDRGHDVATPEERDFIEACGVEYSGPWERR